MTSTPNRDTRFRVPANLARELAETYGTPLYVIGESHLRDRIRAYRSAFRDAYEDSEIAYASKANSTLAVLAIAAAEGCQIDVASEGELRAALAAGVDPGRCHLHGNNKQRAELEFALAAGIGVVFIDNFAEIETVAELGPGSAKVALRLAPGVDPVTHAKISTGQADTKFGFNIADGSAEKATLRCIELGLPLIGFHCHVGSQLIDPEAQRAGGEFIAAFAADMAQRHGFRASYLNVGGGLGVRYTSEDIPMGIGEYCRLVVEAVNNALAGSGLKPTLAQEPGRALISESGVTLYRVGVVKTVPSPSVGQRTYVCVDGGLSDNPRPALYNAEYEVERIGDPSEPCINVTVSGKHCETDRLFEDIPLPVATASGDLLQVLCTGAYNASMSSNYNRYPRPASVLVRANGTHSLIQRRDTWEEMLARETVPGDLR